MMTQRATLISIMVLMISTPPLQAKSTLKYLVAGGLIVAGMIVIYDNHESLKKILADDTTQEEIEKIKTNVANRWNETKTNAAKLYELSVHKAKELLGESTKISVKAAREGVDIIGNAIQDANEEIAAEKKKKD